jgi:hypothetical protein
MLFDLAKGNPAFEGWLRQNPEHELMAVDYPAKVEAEARRVNLPCNFKSVETLQLSWGLTSFLIDISDVNTPEDLKANLYHTLVLDNCAAATLTVSDFENIGDGVSGALDESLYLSRRLLLSLCEGPEFATTTAKIMHFVLQSVSKHCGTHEE